MAIKIVTTSNELKKILFETRLTFANEKSALCSVGFVPTMGALHDGHRTLIKKCVEENDISVVSIFVNPKQFGPKEDFSKYPRVLQEDCALCTQEGVDIVFAPGVEEIYPEPFLAQIVVAPEMKSILCGVFRPGHFDGVATVVTLLLNMVMPKRAYFGQKDFQQYFIINKIRKDFSHPTE
ncbi:MAG: pantoate--beta-alanine ligase, partial [Silvanigrellaceae bacterium]|nr:pantoate--beta-alanine ligase [Silvanigrellaceae bacterium]